MSADSASDTWRPVARPEVLRLRAGLKARARAFFEATGALEVDTPVLSAASPTDPNLEPLRTATAARPGRPCFLQTSPEFAMKRLLAAGVGDCWQFARVFRDGERGRWHNPEFDLLEWYRVDCDHHELMDEVEALVAALLQTESRIPPAERRTYVDAFAEFAGVDIDMNDGRARTERRRFAGRAVVETYAGAEQQIALFQNHVGIPRPVHTEHAQV